MYTATADGEELGSEDGQWQCGTSQRPVPEAGGADARSLPSGHVTGWPAGNSGEHAVTASCQCWAGGHRGAGWAGGATGQILGQTPKCHVSLMAVVGIFSKRSKSLF